MMMANGSNESGCKQPLLTAESDPSTSPKLTQHVGNGKNKKTPSKPIYRCILFHVLFTTLAASYLFGGAWIIRYLEMKHIEEAENRKFGDEDRIRQEIRGFIGYVKDMNIPSFDDYNPYAINEFGQNEYPYRPLVYASNLEERVHRLIQSVIMGVREYGLHVDDIYVPQFNPSLASAVRGRVISANGSPVHYWQSYPDSLFFAFSLISTIGSNALYPEGTMTRQFCVAYTLVGIPLFWLATANICYFILSAIYSVYRFFKHYCCLILCSNDYDDESDEPGPPSTTLTFVLLFTIICGYIAACGGILPIWEHYMHFEDGIVYGFMTVTLVGMGHVVPSTESAYAFAATLGIMWLGTMLVVLFVQVLGCVFNKIHYCGRNIKGCRSSRVWVNGHQFTVHELFRFFAKELDAREENILRVGHELDKALQSLLDEREAGKISKKSSVIDNNELSPQKSNIEPEKEYSPGYTALLDEEGQCRNSGDYDNMHTKLNLDLQQPTIPSVMTSSMDENISINGTIVRRQRITTRDTAVRCSVYTPMKSPDGATIV